MKMQMLVDDVWVDIGPTRDFTFTPDEQEAEPSEPVSAQQSWSMPVTFDDPEGLRELIARLEHEATLERWRSRYWLSRPYTRL